MKRNREYVAHLMSEWVNGVFNGFLVGVAFGGTSVFLIWWLRVHTLRRRTYGKFGR